jgi:hypothetical protein
MLGNSGYSRLDHRVFLIVSECGKVYMIEMASKLANMCLLPMANLHATLFSRDGCQLRYKPEGMSEILPATHAPAPNGCNSIYPVDKDRRGLQARDIRLMQGDSQCKTKLCQLWEIL